MFLLRKAVENDISMVSHFPFLTKYSVMNRKMIKYVFKFSFDEIFFFKWKLIRYIYIIFHGEMIKYILDYFSAKGNYRKS